MSREELEKWNCEGLATFCRENKIPHHHGKNRFRKSEMVDAILKQQEQLSETINEEKIEENGKVGVATKEVKEAADLVQLPGTRKYLENIDVGTLVAFKEPSGRLNTAAVQNVSFKREQLKLVTQYGKEFIVSFDDVIWIRTTKRWPKFVLDVLKQQSRRNQNGFNKRQEAE